MNFFRGVMGGQSGGTQPSGVETIQKLCDRVASSTLLEDRRDAVRALKSLSKKYRMEVGTQAMEHLIRILQSDRSDSEILGYALDTLYNIICNEEEEEQDGITDRAGHRQGGAQTGQGTDRAGHRQGGAQAGAGSQAGAGEVIRNDGLLLLQQLTKGNAAIQKIVAFENAFERLLDIITEEGTSDGGIVVEDCLLLLLNLLKNNSSNQNFFKEGSFIQRMKQWFQLGEESGGGWSAQKVTNLHLMLQLVRVMVSPVNSPGATASCQKSMFQCGLLQQLCTILMATGVPADILTETINTVSEVIRGSQVNQDYFASVNAPSNPPRPAIVVLLMSMVNERQPFVLRCAVLYCFQCFLYKNHKGQAEIVSTLLPSTIDAQSISAGQLLCGGLFSTDSLSNWCASVALAHALHDNSNQKEQLLRVQLATSLGKPPISLLQQCTNILSQGSKVQTRVGLLMLLCTWISNCPIAVTHFLHNQENVPFLTAQISENLGEDERLVQGLCALLLGICIYYNDNSLENYTKEKLKQLIEKRIGKENFVEKLGFITKHELYSRAAQKPQPSFSTPEHMLFDHEFTKLVKELEGVITKAVHKSSEEEKKEEEVKKTLEQHDSIVTQYKELIRDQDAQLTELKEQVQLLTRQKEQMDITITQQLSQIQQHKDQYNILKLKLGKDGAGSQGDVQVNGVQVEELTALRVELEELRTQHTLLQTQLTEKDTLITSLKSEVAQTSEGSAPASDNTKLLKEVEALRVQVQSQQAEISQLQSERHALQRRIQTTSGSGSEAEIVKLSELEQRLSTQTAETHRLQEEVRSHSESRAQLEKELAEANSTVAILQTEKSKLQQEVSESKKEQDDLLVLLADQDQKIFSLKQRLKNLGETIEDEDDLDARDQSDEDDDEEDEEDDGETE
ncbi:hypothetical protein HF521_008897 [Silurus meridionalis]|uniref:General vesicular transport factor p115 n=1 Tax=Silurus meridionalis TaxID=175797 RepID=A0A8T0BT38_SILME|nr:hypothetical protein HF521_008897 [Silurus meridionalis]